MQKKQQREPGGETSSYVLVALSPTLGVFEQKYRWTVSKNWIEMVKSFNIKSNDDISLNAVLGNQVKIKQWLIDKLPNDTFSIDNAIILDNS